ncbi:DNA/RNA polymerase, partial [Parathielavia hyrcaniae]
MDPRPIKKAPRRRNDRCVENRQPSLKTLPLGIKQKGILATCNYAARRHGVKKLMPIAEAKRLCPDLVLADGEDLSPFRDVSKRLYALLRSHSWNAKVERLGLDEVFMDVTDIVSYNVELLNQNALPQSYFCLSRTDPEVGFEYDATSFSGCVHGEDGVQHLENVLYMRLLLASHLAQHLRLKIEDEGYTTACGIATNKLLAKLVSDKNKPRNQTTLLALHEEDILSFMDGHPLRKVPGIGFKTTSILEGFILNQEPDTDMYSMECSTTVGQARTHPSMSPATLERLLSGPGAEKGVGSKVWSLLHGADETDVKPGRDVPAQISIEDTYKGDVTQPHEIRRELLAITASLLRRMHVDLLDDTPANTMATTTSAKWLAHPKTLRLSTRPYLPPTSERHNN